MNTLFKSAKILGLGALLIHGASAHARVQLVEVSCTQAGIPPGRIGNRLSASGNLRLHRKGATSGVLSVTLGGSARPVSIEVDVSGITMNDGGEGIRNLDAPTIIQLVSSDDDKNRESLKAFKAESLVLTAVASNARGSGEFIDLEAEGQSLIALASAEEISENKAREVPMSCSIELK